MLSLNLGYPLAPIFHMAQRSSTPLPRVMLRRLGLMGFFLGRPL